MEIFTGNRFFEKSRKLLSGYALEPEIPPFTRWVTFGAHLCRQAGESSEVEFVDEGSGKRRRIVDNGGRIIRFPGIEKGEWLKFLESENSLQPTVRFRTEFRKYDDTHYIMVWQVQPDGRYWEDSDGFGASGGEEICLYALLDCSGRFTGPFRIYSVGARNYTEVRE